MKMKLINYLIFLIWLNITKSRYNFLLYYIQKIKKKLGMEVVEQYSISFSNTKGFI